MPHFYFFSYGSNLLFERIRERTPSVEVVQTYCLEQFKLTFNKLSKDGSTKANISHSNESYVWGVIHRINLDEKKDLDRAEGLGYGYELDFFEKLINSEVVQIGYYIAKDSKFLSRGKPFDWYFEYVKYGAQENGFPHEYQESLQSIQYVKDRIESRRIEHEQILSKYR